MSFSPFFRSPLTDLTGTLLNHQWYGRCAKIEMKMLDCIDAYGLTKGQMVCIDLMEDFKECANRQKQIRRTAAMRIERNRQYSKGERSKEDRYAESPRKDSF